MSRTVGRSDGRTARRRVAVIPGDGIGPEVIDAALEPIEQAAARHGLTLELERLPYGADHYLKTKETLPDRAFHHLRDDADAILLGAIGDPRSSAGSRPSTATWTPWQWSWCASRNASRSS